jgi:hypothetical protein
LVFKNETQNIASLPGGGSILQQYINFIPVALAASPEEELQGWASPEGHQGWREYLAEYRASWVPVNPDRVYQVPDSVHIQFER